MAGITAFREAYLSANLADDAEFTDFKARLMRYALYWAFYENSAYRDIHNWAKAYRMKSGLYKYIRGIYNPSYRLGEFWKAHLWGGRLSAEANDDPAGALPIATKNDSLRKSIAQLWRWSNWQVRKDIAALYGAILGDVGIEIVDDTERGKVYMQPVHPSIIKDIDLDPFGNVKGYQFEEKREDPESPGKMVVYLEEVTRDGENVVYRTYKNGNPYAWNGEAAEWAVPYGFVPLVVIQHNNVGLDWGWSELHAGRSKFQEADDLASKLSDQIRKMVHAPWLFVGVSKPKATPTAAEGAPTDYNPEPGREEIPAIYGPAGADAKPLVANLDLTSTLEAIREILQEIERDYPELQMDIWTASKDTSGRALRVARERVTTKVDQRRAVYDDALVRAQQMAVAIGGFRGYEGFQGFGLESYAAGALDHAIGERPVFAKDPLDEYEIEAKFWETAEAARKLGMPIELFLEEHGWEKEKINRFLGSEEYKAHLSNLRMASLTADRLDGFDNG